MHEALRATVSALFGAYLLYHYKSVISVIRWLLYLMTLPVTLTLTLHLDGLHVLFIMIVLGVVAWVVVQYWGWRKYAKLKEVPNIRAPPFELRPIEAPPVDPRATLLASIRIFGFLEEDVYDTLMSNTQESTLCEGERLETSNRDFIIVIEGRVQLRMPYTRPSSILTLAIEALEDGSLSSKDQEESVLTEVGPGGIVSSLFDVLAIFTQTNPPLGPPVAAVAVTNSRILTIPESAFENLRREHTKASAHIVQVIMSRFQRVTFLTLQKYLGLSREARCIEQSLNNYDLHDDSCCRKNNSNSSYNGTRRFSYQSDDPTNKASQPGNYKGDDDGKYNCPYHLPSITDLFGIDIGSPTTGSNENASAPQLSELMTRMNRQTREAAQQSIFSYVARVFGVKVPRPDSPNSGGAWEMVSLRVATPEVPLVRQGDRNPGLFILLHGSLIVASHPETNAPGRKVISVVSRPGSLVGVMAAFMGQHSLVTVTAQKECLVAFIGQRQLEWIVDRHPEILLTLAGRLLEKLSPMVRAIDLALEWVHLSAGQVMCRQGERAEHIYIVLHGRLRCIKDGNEELEVLAEYGSGQSVGEIEMLLQTTWAGTFHAIRDTDIASMPRILFDALSIIHPDISLNISRILARKSQMESKDSTLLQAKQNNFRTVAIMPVSSGMHRLAVEFAQRLRDEISTMDSVLLLDSATIIDVLGRHAFSAIGKLKLLEWLNQVEEEQRIVIYLVDSTVQSKWTQRCIRQADCILLIANADADPAIGAYERLLLGAQSSAARKELVLVHGEMDCPSGLTRTWLSSRIWIMSHHHVCMPDQIDIHGNFLRNHKRSQLWQVVQNQLEKYGLADITVATTALVKDIMGPHRRPSLAGVIAMISNNDFGRLARRLLGRTIGIVLGGGGARGLSHLGLIQALVEAGIPIDAVGGTSIGAFLGALYARDVDYYTAQAFARSFCQKISSRWRALSDLTYPITSWFTGHGFNKVLWKIFRERMIEDLWLPFFCITTDIARSKMVVHREGYIWRYVRASMSLSGFVPPLCDGGALLVDGGYLNNVPVDVMMNGPDGVSMVIAIDIGAEGETDLPDYGDTLSGFWLIFQRAIGRYRLIPTLTEIQSRLAYVSCTAQLAKVKAAAAEGNDIFYLRPPVQNYAIMDFARYSEIFAIGYAYGQEVLEKWRDNGTLDRLLGFQNSLNDPSKFDLRSNDNDFTLMDQEGVAANCPKSKPLIQKSFADPLKKCPPSSNVAASFRYPPHARRRSI